MNLYVTGNTIKQLREQKKMTQADLADKIDVSSKTVSKWETAKGLPDISLLEPLSAALGVSVMELMKGDAVINQNRFANLLRSKLYELEMEKQQSAEAEARRSQIGTGDRSEKIRTYNFPQGRVTDHRIKLTLHKLDSVLNGDLDEIIDSLTAADQAARLANMNEEV